MCGRYTLTIDKSTIEKRFGARLETAATKPMFANSFVGRHCFVLADMLVFCFAERDYTQQFNDRFGGEC